MKYATAAILLGGLSLIFLPISLIFKTTIIYVLAKSIGLGLALGAGYFSIYAIAKVERTLGIMGLNLAVIDLIIHLLPF